MAAACAIICAAPANAASGAGASRGVVLSQISVRNTGDLDFGRLLRGTTAGRVTINPTTGARTVTGGVVAAGGTPRRATFDIVGTANRVITLAATPGSVTLTNGTGGSMTVNTFRFTGTAATRRLSAAGTLTVGVGARLNVAANQADGVYSGVFTLTVNYQ